MFILCIAAAALQAQVSREPAGRITGRVLDGQTSTPVEYANIILRSHADSAIVNGAMSDAGGLFRIENIKPGRYFVELKFIGYEDFIRNSVIISPELPVKDLGSISMKRSVIAMAGVQVEADRPIINYEIDKRVIDVSKQATSESGSALELLQNVPSVNVDFDGNVTLRGSSSFSVMIDGKPSILDASDALEQIPASSIEQIEIITNPSVKYDPEGMAGIINIVTARKKLTGTSGLANISVGTNNDISGDVLLNVKKDSYSWFVKGALRTGARPGTSESERFTDLDSIQISQFKTGESSRNRNHRSLQTGIEFYPDDRNTYALTASVGRYEGKHGSDDSVLEQTVFQGDTSLTSYRSVEISDRRGDYASLSADYTHKFNGEGHNFIANIELQSRDGDEYGKSLELSSPDSVQAGMISREFGPSQRLRYKADYTLPLSKDRKFEAGVEGHGGNIRDETRNDVWNPVLLDYVTVDSLARNVEYRRRINGAYALFSDKYAGLGIQIGLRVEHTYRYISSLTVDSSYSINRIDPFPSLHMSYDLSGGDQLIASYSRRIDRPRGYNLEPFRTWTDSRNIWQGNPELLPAYTNSLEAGYKKILGQHVVYLDLFYRQTLNVDERISEPLYGDVWLNTIKNVGTATSAGLETSVNLSFAKVFSSFLTMSVYDYRLVGNYEGTGGTVVFDTGNTRWDARLTSTWRASGSLQFQMLNRYDSRRTSAQGVDEGMFITDLSMKYTVIKNKLTANLQVRDLFGTGIHEFTNEGENWTSHTVFTRNSPTLSLSLKYNFNNFKEKRGEGERGGDMMEDDF